MTLSELLEELKGIDPETYEALRNCPIYCSGEGALTVNLLESRNHVLVADALQGCIQRACERREWHWLVCMDCWREGEYRAEMSIISESCISDMVEITTIAMKWGDSATEALLAAYIAAVREEAKR